MDRTENYHRPLRRSVHFVLHNKKHHLLNFLFGHSQFDIYSDDNTILTKS